MVNGLAALGAGVDRAAVSSGGDAFLLGELGGDQEQVAQELFVPGFGGLQSLQVLLGDDQDMGGGLGVDVSEGQALLILEDDIGGDLPADDLAKNGLGHVLKLGPALAAQFAQHLHGGNRQGNPTAQALLAAPGLQLAGQQDLRGPRHPG